MSDEKVGERDKDFLQGPLPEINKPAPKMILKNYEFRKGNKHQYDHIKAPPYVRQTRALTNAQVKEVGDKLLTGTRDDLMQILRNKDSTPLSAWIAAVALKGIQKGDAYSLNELLNRLIGKVKETVEHVIPQATIIRRFGSDEQVEMGGAIPAEAREVPQEEQEKEVEDEDSPAVE